MENKELLEMVRSKAQSWLTKSYDAEHVHRCRLC